MGTKVQIVNSIQQGVRVAIKPLNLPLRSILIRPGESLPNDDFPDIIEESFVVAHTRELARKGYIQIIKAPEQAVTVEFDASASYGIRGEGPVSVGVKLSTSDFAVLDQTVTVEVYDDGAGSGVADTDYTYTPNPQTITFNPGDADGLVKFITLTPIETLIGALTSAAGSAPRGLWVPGIQTYKNVGLDPCANGDAVYRIDDLTGNGYHLVERAAGQGGTYNSPGAFGTQPTITFDRSNAEGLFTTIDMDAGVSNLLEAAAYAQVCILQVPDMGVDQSQANRNPPIFGQPTTNGRPYTVLRDTGDPPSQYAVGGSGGGASTRTTVSYGTPYVASHRHASGTGYSSGQDKSKAARAGSGSLASLAKKMYVAHNISDTGGTVYLSGDFGMMAAFGADLSDSQLDAVVDVLRSRAGVAAV